MNLKQLSRKRGESFRLRPRALAILSDGSRRTAPDDSWYLQDVLDAPSRLALRHDESGRTLELQSDNVREFRSPDFLLLRCQLVLRGDGIEIEPVLGGGASFSNALPIQEVHDQLRSVPLLGKKDLEQSLRGVAVTCSGRLGSLAAEADGKLKVGVIGHEVDVWCRVDRSRYPKLAVAKAGIAISVTGYFGGRLIGGYLFDDAELTLD